MLETRVVMLEKNQSVGVRAYPKRGLTLWRQIRLHEFLGLAGEGQTPFRIGS